MQWFRDAKKRLDNEAKKIQKEQTSSSQKLTESPAAADDESSPPPKRLKKNPNTKVVPKNLPSIVDSPDASDIELPIFSQASKKKQHKQVNHVQNDIILQRKSGSLNRRSCMTESTTKNSPDEVEFLDETLPQSDSKSCKKLANSAAKDLPQVIDLSDSSDSELSIFQQSEKKTMRITVSLNQSLYLLMMIMNQLLKISLELKTFQINLMKM